MNDKNSCVGTPRQSPFSPVHPDYITTARNSSEMNPQKENFSKARTVPKFDISRPTRSIIIPTLYCDLFKPYYRKNSA